MATINLHYRSAASGAMKDLSKTSSRNAGPAVARVNAKAAHGKSARSVRIVQTAARVRTAVRARSGATDQAGETGQSVAADQSVATGLNAVTAPIGEVAQSGEAVRIVGTVQSGEAVPTAVAGLIAEAVRRAVETGNAHCRRTIQGRCTRSAQV